MLDKDVRVICEKEDMEAFFASIPITGKTIKDIKCIGIPEGLKRSGHKEHHFLDLYNNLIANGYSKPAKWSVVLEDFPDELSSEEYDVLFLRQTVYDVIHILFEDDSALVIQNKDFTSSHLGVGYYEKEPEYSDKEEKDGTILFKERIDSKVQEIVINELTNEADKDSIKGQIMHPYDGIQVILDNGFRLKIDYWTIAFYDGQDNIPIRMTFDEEKKSYTNLDEWFSDESVDREPIADINSEIDSDLIKLLEQYNKPRLHIFYILLFIRRPEARKELADYIRNNNPDVKSFYRFHHALYEKERERANRLYNQENETE